VALWQGLGTPRGHTGACTAAPPHCGTLGSRAPKRTHWLLRRLLAHPLLASGSRPWPSGRSPPGPRPALSSEALPAWRSAPPGPYFKYDLWSGFHRPPPPRAHNGLGVLCGFYLGFVCPRPSRGSLLPPRCAPPRPPLRFALGCPRRAPKPSGAHTQGRFLPISNQELAAAANLRMK
jgi:hypothetical protein